MIDFSAPYFKHPSASLFGGPVEMFIEKREGALAIDLVTTGKPSQTVSLTSRLAGKARISG
ncbi:MAG: hypothetical protein ACODAD_16110, partial [Planctomycetota bacterium]